MTEKRCKMGSITLGPGEPLAFICGPCVAEDKSMAQDYAGRLKALSDKHQIPMLFKASFD